MPKAVAVSAEAVCGRVQVEDRVVAQAVKVVEVVAVAVVVVVDRLLIFERKR